MDKETFQKRISEAFGENLNVFDNDDTGEPMVQVLEYEFFICANDGDLEVVCIPFDDPALSSPIMTVFGNGDAQIAACVAGIKEYLKH